MTNINYLITGKLKPLFKEQKPIEFKNILPEAEYLDAGDVSHLFVAGTLKIQKLESQVKNGLTFHKAI